MPLDFNENIERFLNNDWCEAANVIKYWRYQKSIEQLGNQGKNRISIEDSETQEHSKKITFQLTKATQARLLKGSSINASVIRGILVLYKLYDFTTPIDGTVETISAAGVDLKKSPIMLFQEAAVSGHIMAYKILCDLYEHGDISKLNYVEVIAACKKALNSDSGSDKIIALNLLGHIYEHGFGVLQDYPKARQYYEEAVNLNLDNLDNLDKASALANLGCFYGECLKDYTAAKKYCELAATLGNAKASAYLGYIYERGLDVSKDDNEMLQKYQQAAKLGDAIAWIRLGYFYERCGHIKSAQTCYIIASNLGEVYALKALAHLYTSKFLPYLYTSKFLPHLHSAFRETVNFIEHLEAKAVQLGCSIECNKLTARILGGNFDELDTEPGSSILAVLENVQDGTIQTFLEFLKITAYMFQRREKDANYDYQIRVNDFWQLIHQVPQSQANYITYLDRNHFAKKYLHSNTYLSFRNSLHRVISSVSSDDFTKGLQLYLSYLNWHATQKISSDTQKEVLRQLLGGEKPYVMAKQPGFFSRTITEHHDPVSAMDTKSATI